ncbi:MAG: FemAB family PEP-CTERM system-associated protein [Gammaproteobacteria bacterium]|nr:FemAB family PEP-CTERM system-associated protein [Gammaproteobacteria bacterium]
MKSVVLERSSESDIAVRIRPCTDTDEPAWEQFVSSCRQATFFHRYGWKRVISRAFGHTPHYLIAERDNKICGVLPLFHLRSFLFGNSLISVPFCVYGGVAANDEDSSVQLIAAGMELAQELQVDYLELRSLVAQKPEWPVKELYVTFRKAISADPDENLKAIPRKQRAMIRRAMKANLESSQGDDIDTLYAMYSESVRNLGTPVFSKRYLRLLDEEFGDACETTIIRHEGRPVAGVMSFYFRDEVLPYYGGGSSAARAVSANDFLYWQVMCRAVERGVTVFDYGRSKINTGSYRFKKHWGFTPVPLQYEYGLVRATEIPNLSPTNPRYRLFIDLWKRMPLPLSRVIGPMLARSLG